MVSDLHRGQDGNDGKLLVSDICTPNTTGWLLIIPQTQARSVIQRLMSPLSHLYTQHARRTPAATTEDLVWTRRVNPEDS